MIIYHSNQIAAFTSNHVFYFQFQPLFSQFITVTTGPDQVGKFGNFIRDRRRIRWLTRIYLTSA